MELEDNTLYVSVYDAKDKSLNVFEITGKPFKELCLSDDKEKWVKENIYEKFNDECSLDISPKTAIYITKADGTQESMEFGNY